MLEATKVMLPEIQQLFCRYAENAENDGVQPSESPRCYPVAFIPNNHTWSVTTLDVWREVTKE
jgi:hypothetical protein